MRRVAGMRAPGLAKGGRGASFSAVPVTFAAEIEVGPLGNVAGTRNATGIGAQEIRLLEGRRVRDAGKDDEEEKDDGGGRQDETCEAEGGVWLRC
jgi:hypothetical protein